MNEKFSSKKFSLMKIFQKWEKFSSKWQKIFNKVIKSSYKSLRDELAANNKIFKNFSIFCIWRTSDLTIDNHSNSIHIIYYVYFFSFSNSTYLCPIFLSVCKSFTQWSDFFSQFCNGFFTFSTSSTSSDTIWLVLRSRWNHLIIIITTSLWWTRG